MQHQPVKNKIPVKTKLVRFKIKYADGYTITSKLNNDRKVKELLNRQCEKDVSTIDQRYNEIV